MKKISVRGKNEAGNVYGRLTVLRRHGSNKDKKALWLCECECGGTHITSGRLLRSGKTKSCGCLNSETRSNLKHGLRDHPLYTVWCSMRSRCTYPSMSQYKDYGGRGISVCSEWEDPKVFIDWCIENGWKSDLQIDRIDNDGNYTPMNCRIVTQLENARKTRRSRMLTYNGETKCMSAWVGFNGITAGMLKWRIRQGWSTERALTTPRRVNQHG